VTRRGSRLRLSGSAASDCGDPIRVVQVAVARRVHGGCRWLTVGGAMHKTSSCDRPFWLLARGGGSGWRLAIPRIGAGRYLLRVRAVDTAGRSERPRGRSLTVRRAADAGPPSPSR
jgi:hypothetical protein